MTRFPNLPIKKSFTLPTLVLKGVGNGPPDRRTSTQDPYNRIWTRVGGGRTYVGEGSRRRTPNVTVLEGWVPRKHTRGYVGARSTRVCPYVYVGRIRVERETSVGTYTEVDQGEVGTDSKTRARGRVRYDTRKDDVVSLGYNRPSVDRGGSW